MSRSRVSFTIDHTVVDELDQISRELKEKKSHIVEKALTLYFDRLDVTIADKRIKDVREGKAKLIPSEVVYKRLGI